MGGGPSPLQEQAAASQNALTTQMAASGRARDAFQLPYLQSRVQGGLPFKNQFTDYGGGAVAQSFAPQKAALNRRLDAYGGSLPSGFREQALSDMGVKQAHAFDNNLIQGLMMDEEAKARAAGLANPLGFFGGAQQGNASIMNMPVQPSPWGSILGGALGGLVGMAGG